MNIFCRVFFIFYWEIFHKKVLLHGLTMKNVWDMNFKHE